jgi:phosphoribosylglycinamide formyltransferase-1
MNESDYSIAVLISGTGSNLKTLIEAAARGRLDIRISHVISNREQAPGLDHARRAGIPYTVIGKSSHGDRELQDRAIVACLEGVRPDLVLLSGFMRIVGPTLINAFADRMINQHPSLLPRFPGLDTYRRVLEAGDAEHGASIHFVTEELDGGPLISQVRIPVLAGDTPSTLAARLGPIEHELLLATVELFAARRVKNRQGRVLLDGEILDQPLRLNSEYRFA